MTLQIDYAHFIKTSWNSLFYENNTLQFFRVLSNTILLRYVAKENLLSKLK